MLKVIEENKLYEISKLDESTYLVWDKSKNIPSPHYYKSFSSASKKCLSIVIKNK